MTASQRAVRPGWHVRRTVLGCLLVLASSAGAQEPLRFTAPAGTTTVYDVTLQFTSEEVTPEGYRLVAGEGRLPVELELRDSGDDFQAQNYRMVERVLPSGEIERTVTRLDRPDCPVTLSYRYRFEGSQRLASRHLSRDLDAQQDAQLESCEIPLSHARQSIGVPWDSFAYGAPEIGVGVRGHDSLDTTSYGWPVSWNFELPAFTLPLVPGSDITVPDPTGGNIEAWQLVHHWRYVGYWDDLHHYRMRAAAALDLFRLHNSGTEWVPIYLLGRGPKFLTQEVAYHPDGRLAERTSRYVEYNPVRVDNLETGAVFFLAIRVVVAERIREFTLPAPQPGPASTR